MVSPKQPTGSLPPTENKRPSLSFDDVPPFSKHPEAEAAANGKIEAAAEEKVDAAADGKGDAAVDSGVFTPAPNPTVEVNKNFLAVGANKDTPGAAMTCFKACKCSALNLDCLDIPICSTQQGKWVALLDRKGSGNVQVNGKTISKYSFCFLNSGDEVILSQAENNAYIVQLLLESPSDVGTSAGKGKLLNIENQVEDALAIARAFDLSVFSNPCRDLFSLKPTSQLDGLELDSAANIGSNKAADFELSIGTGNAKSFAEPFLLSFLL
ncbi:hypothetical protein CQW23_32345 [Capsicum baccatum]|uniref:FHA domain-containing protein n=1 Tax=Capsicum baccatum TaxID=33114 RepID=A0A2G2V523_CAPBA|nr:hypothetical protein CQW23_32345 [Capsicum baccatum]